MIQNGANGAEKYYNIKTMNIEQEIKQTDLIKKWNKEIKRGEDKLDSKDLTPIQRATLLFQNITLENCINDLRKLK